MEDVQHPAEVTAARSGSVFSALDVEILDRLGDAVLVADLEGRFIEANLAAATMLGYSRRELLSLSVREVTAWPAERVETEFARFLTDGYWRGEVELRRKDGTTITVDSRSSILETPAGRRALAIHREPDPDLATLQAAERRLVDTTRYRYWFYTQLATAAQASALELRLVQVTSTRG